VYKQVYRGKTPKYTDKGAKNDQADIVFIGDTRVKDPKHGSFLTYDLG
jgi:hypothetical protein